MMVRYFATLLIVISLLVGAACDKTKTLKQLEDIATQMRIHNRNIARVANEFHDAGKLSDAFHFGVLTACDKFSTALDGADAAIVAAKKVASGDEAKSALDYAQRLLDTDVFLSFVAIAEAVTNVPAEVKQRIETVLASIRLLFATVRSLLSENHAARKEVYANA